MKIPPDHLDTENQGEANYSRVVADTLAQVISMVAETRRKSKRGCCNMKVVASEAREFEDGIPRVLAAGSASGRPRLVA